MFSNPVLKRNNVKVVGNGQQVILFAHGFGCDQNAWQFVVNDFIDDYKVVYLITLAQVNRISLSTKKKSIIKLMVMPRI